MFALPGGTGQMSQLSHTSILWKGHALGLWAEVANWQPGAHGHPVDVLHLAPQWWWWWF